MNKFRLLLLISVILVTVVSIASQSYSGENGKFPKSDYLLSRLEYSKLKSENIKSAGIIRYTIAGVEEKNLTDRVEIDKVYNYLSQIRLGRETDMSCTDNTTVYIFNLEDGTKLSIEKECDWIILGNKSYMIK